MYLFNIFIIFISFYYLVSCNSYFNVSQIAKSTNNNSKNLSFNKNYHSNKQNFLNYASIKQISFGKSECKTKPELIVSGYAANFANKDYVEGCWDLKDAILAGAEDIPYVGWVFKMADRAIKRPEKTSNEMKCLEELHADMKKGFYNLEKAVNASRDIIVDLINLSTKKLEFKIEDSLYKNKFISQRTYLTDIIQRALGNDRTRGDYDTLIRSCVTQDLMKKLVNDYDFIMGGYCTNGCYPSEGSLLLAQKIKTYDDLRKARKLFLKTILGEALPLKAIIGSCVYFIEETIEDQQKIFVVYYNKVIKALEKAEELVFYEEHSKYNEMLTSIDKVLARAKDEYKDNPKTPKSFYKFFKYRIPGNVERVVYCIKDTVKYHIAECKAPYCIFKPNQYGVHVLVFLFFDKYDESTTNENKKKFMRTLGNKKKILYADESFDVIIGKFKGFYPYKIGDRGNMKSAILFYNDENPTIEKVGGPVFDHEFSWEHHNEYQHPKRSLLELIAL